MPVPRQASNGYLERMGTEKKIRAARILRQRETDLEHQLWQQLRNRKTSPFKFRRQHPIGPYVVDSACPAAKLVIEIDGYWHKVRAAADNFRTDRLRDHGYEVVRFETTDAGNDLNLLVEAIIHAVKDRIGSLRSR